MDALSPDDSRALADALTAGDVTVFVDGTSLRLPEPARRGVEALLAALARGESVRVGPAPASGPRAGTTPGAVVGPEFLTTSQAAQAAGISLTYLRNLTNAGEIPVEYRGTHRRFRTSDIAAWVERNRERREQKGH